MLKLDNGNLNSELASQKHKNQMLKLDNGNLNSELASQKHKNQILEFDNQRLLQDIEYKKREQDREQDFASKMLQIDLKHHKDKIRDVLLEVISTTNKIQENVVTLIYKTKYQDSVFNSLNDIQFQQAKALKMFDQLTTITFNELDNCSIEKLCEATLRQCASINDMYSKCLNLNRYDDSYDDILRTLDQEIKLWRDLGDIYIKYDNPISEFDKELMKEIFVDSYKKLVLYRQEAYENNYSSDDDISDSEVVYDDISATTNDNVDHVADLSGCTGGVHCGVK
jgi:hypothetical protein